MFDVATLEIRHDAELHFTLYEEGQRAMKPASKIIYTHHTSAVPKTTYIHHTCSCMTCCRSNCASNATMWLRHKLSQQFCSSSKRMNALSCVHGLRSMPRPTLTLCMGPPLSSAASNTQRRRRSKLIFTIPKRTQECASRPA
jgi:hypothetical protein